MPQRVRGDAIGQSSRLAAHQSHGALDGARTDMLAHAGRIFERGDALFVSPALRGEQPERMPVQTPAAPRGDAPGIADILSGRALRTSAQCEILVQSRDAWIGGNGRFAVPPGRALRTAERMVARRGMGSDDAPAAGEAFSEW